MQQEIRFATFNVCNLALPGMRFYSNLEPYTTAQYAARLRWTADLIDRLDADVIGFQEVFSQQALKEVLAASRKYAHAHHAGFEPVPDPQTGQLTPSVALVSRFPFAAPPTATADLPRGLSAPLPGVAQPMTRFTRPVLHAPLALSKELLVNAFVVHLKSQRPDFRNGESDDDPYELGSAMLRSLIRRGTEALGLRYLLTDYVVGTRVPLVLMGDFNDVAASVSTQLVLGSGRHGKNGFDDRLFDCYRIQLRRDPLRDIGYSFIFDGSHETIDHVLVSEEFNPESRHAIGDVLDVAYVNDHLALRPPEASDHGAVVVRIRLRQDGNGQAGPGLNG